MDAAKRLTSDLAIFSNGIGSKLVSPNASKTHFLNLPTQQPFPNTYPLFFENTELSLSSKLPLLACLSLIILTKNIIFSNTKSASSPTFSPTDADYIQRHYPSLYGVCITRLGALHTQLY